MAVTIRDVSRIPVGGSCSFVLPDGRAAFAVRTERGFVAYRNECPHWNVDLDMGLGDFVDPRSGRIGCRNHGAEFEIDTGLCVLGPCAGQRLAPLEAHLEADALHVTDASERAPNAP